MTRPSKRVAIYARRSKEHQVASCDVQVEEATRESAAMGWVVIPHLVWKVDGSRAEFKERPSLREVLAAAERKEFDVLVVRDDDRIGGDAIRSISFVQELLDAGVELYFYATKEFARLDSMLAKLQMFMRGTVSEEERRRTAFRTREHLKIKAQKGLNTGGRVYGYDNVPVHVDGTRGKRLYVDYRINDAEAAVVNEMFEMAATGMGSRGIAKRLNDRAVPSPRAGNRGKGTWFSSSVWTILHNERYRGIVPWGEIGHEYRGGHRVEVQRPEDQRIRAERPELRIVPDSLWQAVEAELAKRKRLSGNGRLGPKTRYFLSGVMVCSECGGPYHAHNRKMGKVNVKHYVCAWHRDQGDKVCTNGSARPVENVDRTILAWLEEDVLREEIVLEVLADVRARIKERRKQTDTQLPQFEQNAKNLRAEINRLVGALAKVDDKPEAVIQLIADKEKALRSVEAELEAARAAPAAIDRELDDMVSEAQRRLEDLRGLLSRNPDRARKVLETVLEGNLVATPRKTAEGVRFAIRGNAVLGPLFLTDGDPSGNRRLVNRRASLRRRRLVGPRMQAHRRPVVTQTRRAFRNQRIPWRRCA